MGSTEVNEMSLKGGRSASSGNCLRHLDIISAK